MRINKYLTNQIHKISAFASSLSRTGFFHIFGSSTINQIVGFARGILVVRLISKAEYGTYAFSSNIYSFFMLISGFGIVSAIIQLASENYRNAVRSSSIIQFGYKFGIIFNGVLSAIILFTALFMKLPIEGSNFLLGLMFILPITEIIKDLQKIWLRVNLKNKEYGTINIIDSVLIGSLAILGAWIFQSKGLILGQYIAAILTIFLLWKQFKVPLIVQSSSITKEDQKAIFGIAGISTLINALSHLLTILGTFMLGLIIVDKNVIASYKVASVIPMALNFIPGSLMVFAYPYFARNKNNKSWVSMKYGQIRLYLGLINLLISLIGIAFAEPIIRLIFGTQYADSVIPFRILMFTYFVNGTFRVIPANLLVTQRKLKANLANGILGAFVSILFNAILIPEFGSTGAALSQLITMTVTGIHYTVYFAYAIKNITS